MEDKVIARMEEEVRGCNKLKLWILKWGYKGYKRECRMNMKDPLSFVDWMEKGLNEGWL